MKDKLRVVFFGTPEFAKSSLEAIHKSKHEVVGVVTVADKASGRGQKIHQSPVKIYALENNLPVFQPEKLRDPLFMEQMKNLNADVFVVVAFRMMPKILFELPPLGTFNLHASLLPDYRGAAPINYAIINGETKTGATTFFINEKIDEGNILLQAEVDINPEENAGQLHDKLMIKGAELVVKTLNGLADESIKEIAQPFVENPKLAYKIFKQDMKINWDKSSKEIYDFVRGMSPYPAAFTNISVSEETKVLKVFQGVYELSQHNEKPGVVFISPNNFYIYTKDGKFFPKDLQLEGKKRMPIKDFLNGFKTFEGVEII